MSKNNKALFQYLISEEIFIDEKEFDYQLKSHPNYPSLLAVSDTLSFLGIENAAFKIPLQKFDLLPDTFIAYLKENNDSFLSFIDKKDKGIRYTSSDSKTSKYVSKQEFIDKWDEIVLLAENNELFEKKKKNYNWLPLVLSILLIIPIVQLSNMQNYWYLVFTILPVIGIVFSIGSLNDVFNSNNIVLAKFCGSSSTSNCNTVINSTKWKFFNTIKFSDLSILFFSFQLVTFIVFALMGNYSEYYSLQTILLALSIPVILTSLYYQKFIEKKWCTICLSIILIIVLESIYTALIWNSFSFIVTVNSVLIPSSLALLIYGIWTPLKKILVDNKNLKQVELKANRFKRNYQLFKNTLVTEKKHVLPKSLLSLGNPEAKIKITMLTSPFCGYCKAPHKMLKSLLEKHHKDIEVTFIFNVPETNKNFNVIAKNLIQLKINSDENTYHTAMDSWYEINIVEQWLLKYQLETIDDSVNNSLKEQRIWCAENNYNFTPCLFVNGIKYPDLYDISDLQYFIEEMQEDSTLN